MKEQIKARGYQFISSELMGDKLIESKYENPKDLIYSVFTEQMYNHQTRTTWYQVEVRNIPLYTECWKEEIKNEN